jgi:hypothetical protein
MSPQPVLSKSTTNPRSFPHLTYTGNPQPMHSRSAWQPPNFHNLSTGSPQPIPGLPHRRGSYTRQERRSRLLQQGLRRGGRPARSRRGRDPVRIPKEALVRLDVRAGKGPRARNALIGGLVGVGLGLAMAIAQGETCERHDDCLGVALALYSTPSWGQRATSSARPFRPLSPPTFPVIHEGCVRGRSLEDGHEPILRIPLVRLRAVSGHVSIWTNGNPDAVSAPKTTAQGVLVGCDWRG